VRSLHIAVQIFDGIRSVDAVRQEHSSQASRKKARFEHFHNNLCSGPFSNYDALACAIDEEKFGEYALCGSAWLNGTTKEEAVNSGQLCEGVAPNNAEGCTAKQIIYHTQAAQSEWTYDAMESLFFNDVCEPGKPRRPENCGTCVSTHGMIRKIVFLSVCVCVCVCVLLLKIKMDR
jgi:hypothetical protein